MQTLICIKKILITNIKTTQTIDVIQGASFALNKFTIKRK